MNIPVSDAKGQLLELVRQAEAGAEVVLTRHGRPVARIVAVRPAVDMERRRRALEEVMAAVAGRRSPGPSAARSQDFLYDEDGLPV